jgi:hypothetical protein
MERNDCLGSVREATRLVLLTKLLHEFFHIRASAPRAIAAVGKGERDLQWTTSNRPDPLPRHDALTACRGDAIIKIDFERVLTSENQSHILRISLTS